VSRGLVDAPKDWQYSSFHRYVREGIYDELWGSSRKIVFEHNIGME
jgi:putative transposase